MSRQQPHENRQNAQKKNPPGKRLRPRTNRIKGTTRREATATDTTSKRQENKQTDPTRTRSRELEGMKLLKRIKRQSIDNGEPRGGTDSTLTSRVISSVQPGRSETERPIQSSCNRDRGCSSETRSEGSSRRSTLCMGSLCNS